MNTEKKNHISPGTYIASLNRRIPLTVKMVLVTVIVGVSLWASLDYAQSNKLRRIFYIQLFEKLSEQSMEDRLYIDRYIRSHQVLAEFFITHTEFKDYITKQKWSDEDEIQIKYLDDRPLWFLKSSLLRILAIPRYALLLDPAGKVREVYPIRHDTPPPPLLHPTPLMLFKSHQQSLITKIDDAPYLLASDSLLDEQGNLLATLMFASPIDEGFLIASKGPFIPGRLVALVTIGKNPEILTSSSQAELPSGTLLNDLHDRFLITGQHTYDYGSAEYIIKLVSFIAMSEVHAITKNVIATGRQQRNIIAPVFILTFAVLMILITRRINRLNKRMSDFSQRTLGAKKQEFKKGDQLYILEEGFHRLTEEVVEARDLLKKQAEEKTRLIINNAFDAIITIDAGCVIRTWNPQAEVIFGWTYRQIAGQRVTDTIISPSDFDAIQKGIKNFLDAGEDTIFNRQIQINALHREGHAFPAELAISPARSENAYFFVVIIRDISERKLSENRIRASLSEKEMLLKEIHHRVKNNMQVISSLLNLQSRYLEDSHYAELFDESKNRINSMALVHEKLYQAKDLSNIDFRDYIMSLADNLFMFYGINPSRISLKMDVENVALGIDTAIPCGLIINELLTNSLKYAFPENRSGDLTVAFKRDGAADGNDSKYELSVCDNGIGIPENLDLKEVKSLGLQLVTNLVSHQLQGSIKVDKTAGTAFHITFKELAYKKRV